MYLRIVAQRLVVPHSLDCTAYRLSVGYGSVLKADLVAVLHLYPLCKHFELYCSHELYVYLAKLLVPYYVELRVLILKAPQVVLYGGGRGEELAAAAEAYSKLLFEMARGEKPTEELLEMLEDADIKFDIALEEARKREEAKAK